jgi:hypothetical protein
MASVQELIESLSQYLPECEAYGAAIEPSIGAADQTGGANHDLIGLVACDHKSREVLLVPVSGAGRRRRAMTLAKLLEELKALGADCADYSVEATFRKPGPRDLLRIDLPIRAWRLSHDEQVCAFTWR